MNEILQKRIEEAASHYLLHEHKSPLNEILHQCDLKTEMQYHRDIEQAYIEGGKNSLQNQWIPVEEALPPYDENGISKEVIVHTGFDTKRLDRYFANCKEWEYSHKNVTHWMSIPSLEGGEK